MRSINWYGFLLTAVLLLTFGSTIAQTKKVQQPFTIGFYNAENLFDTENDPLINDEEYLPTSELKWDQTRYQAKLEALSKVIDSLGGPEGPTVFGMCEIENRKVMEDLVNMPLLKSKNYSIVHKNSPDLRGIDVGFYYKKNHFKVLKEDWINIRLPEDTAFKTRDILVVQGVVLDKNKPTKDTLYLLVNHFPSRRGGQEASDGKRGFVASKARGYVDEVIMRKPWAKVFVMGDLNDEPIDATLTKTLNAGAKPTSTWPKGFLFNAMWDLKAERKGTHYYRGEYSMLDQILLTEGAVNGKGLVAKDGGHIFRPYWVQQHDEKYEGAPLRTFVGKKYFGGYSDHFAVYLYLEK